MTTTPTFRKNLASVTHGEDTKLIVLEDGRTVAFFATDSDTGVASNPGRDIVAQIYDPLGHPLGLTFLVTPPENPDLFNLGDFAVASHGDGFNIVFEQDTEFGTVIRSRLVRVTEDNAFARGDVHTLSTPNPTNSVSGPSVTYDQSSDTYIVTYAQKENSGGQKIMYHKQNAFGSGDFGPAQTLVNTTASASPDAETFTEAVTLKDGTIVVVGNAARVGTGNEDYIMFRKLDADGAPDGAARAIPGTVLNGEMDDQADAAALDGGGMVIAWRNTSATGVSEIQFQQFTPSLTTTGGIKTIHVFGSTNAYSQPEVVGLPDGGFAILWVHDKIGDASQIWLQRFNAAGNEVGTHTQVSWGWDGMGKPDAVVLPDGQIKIAYQRESGGETSSGIVIFDTEDQIINGKHDADDLLVAKLEASIVYGDGGLSTTQVHGDDRLYAVGEGDTLLGGHGDDTLYSGEGADALYGGGGYDTVSYKYSTAAVAVFLSDLPDGSPQPDASGGYAEGDKLYSIEAIEGSDYTDALYGHAGGGSRINGGDGNDSIFVYGNQNRVFGGKGNDFIEEKGNPTGVFGQDVVYGGDGHDLIVVGDGDNEVYGEAGDDFFRIRVGTMAIDGVEGFVTGETNFRGGEGWDALSYELATLQEGIEASLKNGVITHAAGVDEVESVEALWGSAFDDIIEGDLSANLLNGLSGQDLIKGLGGHDTINGGAAADTLNGGWGDDFVRGGTGGDKLYGGNGDDYLTGGQGRDSLFGGVGGDEIYGDEGDDKAYGADGNDVLRMGKNHDFGSGGKGQDMLYGDGGNDTLEGNDGSDTILGGDGNDALAGGGGKDHLYGENGRDNLKGGYGNDLANGGWGNDLLAGGAGADTLIGGWGADTMTGGAGADVFEFHSFDDATNSSPDRIKDFTIGQDTLDFQSMLLVDLEINLLGSFSGTGPSVISEEYANGDTFVRFDFDADKQSDFRLVLEDVSGLTAGDFTF